jgi:hypothetical protein
MPKKKPQELTSLLNTDGPITVTHPEKIKFWDFSKNASKPSSYSFGQTAKVWWVCDVDETHTWYQSVGTFCKRQADCMFCTRRSVPEHLRLSTKYPEIARDWHPDRNEHLTPDNVSALADRAVWWQCRQMESHEWCASVYARTKQQEGCPYCSQNEVKYKKSLAACARELVPWWSDEDNPGLSPEKILVTSSVVVRWCCGVYDEEQKLGHKFSASIRQMVKRGLECHFCNRERRSHTAVLASAYPEIAAQWHPTKNRGLTPDRIKCGSGMLVWWKCDQAPDHEWRLSVNGRTAKDTGCPFCALRNISSTHSLAVERPEIAAEWHPRKNGKLTPWEIQPSSSEKIWWLCPVGPDHVWKATVVDRTGKDTDCPFCANQAVSVTNTLASQYPEIAAEWHRKRNGLLTPQDIVAGYSKKVWWQCGFDKTHEWQAIVASRTKYGTGCPKCVGLRTPEDKSLQKKYPKIAREWHKTKNGKVTPDLVRPYSGVKYWWQCRKNSEHIWQATPSNRVGAGSRCPFCAGKRVTKETSLKAVYPDLAKQWHKEKNGQLRPDDLLPQSNKKVWWRCPVGPDHEWQASPNDRVSSNTGCPFCAGRRFSITQSLARTNPELAKLWHPTKNKRLTPEMVTCGDTRSVWWVCEKKPEHVWRSAISQRVKAQNACSKCYQSKVKPGNTLQEKYPHVAKQWHQTKNKTLTPDQISAASAQKVWWQCPVNRNHVWAATVTNRTSNGSGCPDCWRNR